MLYVVCGGVCGVPCHTCSPVCRPQDPAREDTHQPQGLTWGGAWGDDRVASMLSGLVIVAGEERNLPHEAALPGLSACLWKY